MITAIIMSERHIYIYIYIYIYIKRERERERERETYGPRTTKQWPNEPTTMNLLENEQDIDYLMS